MTHKAFRLAYGPVTADNKTNLVAHTLVLWINQPCWEFLEQSWWVIYRLWCVIVVLVAHKMVLDYRLV